MKRILWLSRHSPTTDQIEELHRLFGEVEIVQVSTTVKSPDEVVELMKREECDDIVAVLPLNIMAGLTKKGIHPIRAVMNREVLPDGSVNFTFDHFERVERVEVVAHPLVPKPKRDGREPIGYCRTCDKYLYDNADLWLHYSHEVVLYDEEVRE